MFKIKRITLTWALFFLRKNENHSSMELTPFMITIYGPKGKVVTNLDKNTHYCHVLHLHFEIISMKTTLTMVVIQKEAFIHFTFLNGLSIYCLFKKINVLRLAWPKTRQRSLNPSSSARRLNIFSSWSKPEWHTK